MSTDTCPLPAQRRPAPEGLGQAVHDLGQTVWTLAAELDDAAPDGRGAGWPSPGGRAGG